MKAENESVQFMDTIKPAVRILVNRGSHTSQEIGRAISVARKRIPKYHRTDGRLSLDGKRYEQTINGLIFQYEFNGEERKPIYEVWDIAEKLDINHGMPPM